jgi:hypothetical protein
MMRCLPYDKTPTILIGWRTMCLSEEGRRLGGKDAYRFDIWSGAADECDHTEERKVLL